MAHLIDVKNCRDLLIEREFNAQELGYTLRTHFGGQFICFKWENEISLSMIIFRQVDFIAGIKRCFHRISSGHIWHPTINTSSSNEYDVSFIMLCHNNSLFICNNSMMRNVIEKLCIYLDANDLRISFMEYNSEDSSFKPKHQNKNCKEKKYSFSEKLKHRIRRCDSWFRTSCVITSEKPLRDTNNSEKQTISTHKNKRHIKAVEPRTQVHRRIHLKKVSEAQAKNYSFSEKPYHQIRRCDSLFRTSCVITSDKPLKDTNNCEKQTISTHKDKRPIKAVEPRSKEHRRIKFEVSEAPADPVQSVYYVCNVYPLHDTQNKNPRFPEYMDDTRTKGMSLQESIRYMVQRPDQITDLNDIGHGLQSLSLQDERPLCNTLNSYSGASRTPTKYEDSMHTAISSQFISLNGASNVTFELNASQEASKHEMCSSGSSFERSHQFQHNEIGSNNARDSATDYRLPAPLGIQQNIPFGPGLLGDIAPANHQQQQKQQPESSATGVTRPQDVARRQRKETDDLLRVLGRVRSPENASLKDRLHTFSRWPSDIFQTPARVAEAGFYYTGLQDIVRCFACDGGLKNWDPEDDPWVEHARWFPQCVYVRHIKGEEFINLVRMMADESDDESDYTVLRGATRGGVEQNITTTESASNETTEPSVLENKAAQFVLEAGYSERHVALAINYILKKGKLEYTEQDIIDVILEKKIGGERIDSKVACNNSSSVMTSIAAAQTMSENQRLKKLLQCIECNTKERNILFLPCTHHVVCESCSRDLDICTSCYRKIKEKVRTYMA
ncbi:hypothetical protein ACJMK2_028454 [Sinanodonta woodiana]|uniref:RING-type domain-containing protein n=1 Tax=Sinanodonta woodiana TaxID=1069815 RepID=A0ABD3XAQ8_SINWO